jgi:hypothetical protein
MADFVDDFDAPIGAEETEKVEESETILLDGAEE